MPPLVQLLRVSVGTADRLAAPLSDAAWQALLVQAKEQTLVAVLMEGIKRLPAEQQPETETMFTWLAAAERNKQSARKLNKAAVQLSDRLLRDGLRCVLLKGQGVSLLYPDPLTRTPGDIDLWMEGSRKQTVRYIRRFFPKMPVVYHHMDFPVFKKLSVEAHFTPSWMYSPITNRRLQRWFREAWPREAAHHAALPEGAGELSVSTPAFNSVFLCVHIYRHLLDEGVGLRQVLDYFYLLRSHLLSDAERVAALHTLQRLGMRRFTAGLMWTLQHLFGLEDKYLLLPPDASEGEFLTEEIMRAGNFGRADTRFAQEQAGDSHWTRFVRKQRRNLHFLSHYPSETLWHPLWRIWHFFWRRANGYQ
ncbi:MAG: nucleotidyltransferase family protein [Bacteroidaceae bacterium]|nr:nucleotidyltransferase family protein [Bacteroidaceae bacterium]